MSQKTMSQTLLREKDQSAEQELSADLYQLMATKGQFKSNAANPVLKQLKKKLRAARIFS